MSSIQMVSQVTWLPFEYRTPILSSIQMNPVFRCSVFRWLLIFKYLAFWLSRIWMVKTRWLPKISLSDIFTMVQILNVIWKRDMKKSRFWIPFVTGQFFRVITWLKQCKTHLKSGHCNMYPVFRFQMLKSQRVRVWGCFGTAFSSDVTSQLNSKWFKVAVI